MFLIFNTILLIYLTAVLMIFYSFNELFQNINFQSFFNKNVSYKKKTFLFSKTP